MTLSLKHKFTSPKADGPDTTRIRPSNWNDEHDIIMDTQRILGRITASAGPVEDIPLASTLEFSGGSLGVAAATVSRITALENQRVSGVQLGDTDFTHNLLLRAGSNLTANRTLTFTTGDSARNVTLGGDLTTVGNVSISAFMQSLLDDADASAARTTLGAVSSSTPIAWVINSTASATLASFLTFTISDPAKRQVFEFETLVPSTDGVSLLMQVSVDNGANYGNISLAYDTKVSNTTTGWVGEQGSSNAPGARIVGLAGTSRIGNSSLLESGFSGVLALEQHTNYGRFYMVGGYTDDTTVDRVVMSAGTIRTGVDITNVKFQFSSGNMQSGKVVHTSLEA